MKYDEPVKGRLSNGYYWMENIHYGWTDIAIVCGNATQLYGVETAPGSQLRRVSEWRELGWQFYRARLPRVRGKVKS